MYSSLVNAKKSGLKQLAVLIDPDKATVDNLDYFAEYANLGRIDMFLWGGSLVDSPLSSKLLKHLKSTVKGTPVLLFPGSTYQLDKQADGLLLLSLISGRNPDLLIGQHVQVASKIARMKLEVIPTGYILVDGGSPTSVSYMSNTTPIPADKPAIAAATALAGEQLGLKLIYMDAGSGARNAIAPNMIESVSQRVKLPIFVGGGIRDGASAFAALKAGADTIVVGNGLEKNPKFIHELSDCVYKASNLLK